MAISSARRALLAALPDGARRRVIEVRERGVSPRAASSRVAPRPREGDLVFVLSLPRSGTNAFGALLRAGYPSLAWEGEMLFGHVRRRTADVLAATYPWVTMIEDVKHEGLPPERRRALHDDYRRHMNVAAPDVLESLLAGRPTPTAIKVFPTHVSRSTLTTMLEEFRPRVIDLRRRLAFSYVSFLKAQSTGVWSRDVAPDSLIDWRDRRVATYVAQCDEWTTWYSGVVSDLGLETVRVSYEGLYETRADLPRVRAFFGSVPMADAASDEAWAPPTVIQDRRSDATLAQVLQGFEGLSKSNRTALLRHPGD